MSILAVNVGSASIKFALYAVRDNTVGDAEMSGAIEGLEPAGRARIQWSSKGESRQTDAIAIAADQDAFEAALTQLKELLHTNFAHIILQAIAHRVVHGGTLFTASTVITPEVLTKLATLNSLAPLHQPHNLAGIVAFTESFQHLKQIACFDTAFHRTLSPLETTFAIYHKLTDQGVRRFGFHGLSYQYITHVLKQISPRSAGRTIMAHLGNGASLCATTQHESRATTMGFSAVDGLMMGTRSGALDPGVLLFLMEQGWDHDAIEKLLYKQSGLLGVSGESADMRALSTSHSEAARFAIDLFSHRVVREIGALTACIEGLDVLAFTGGIGEHDAAVRAKVGLSLVYLGVSIDSARNQQATGDSVQSIHSDSSHVEVWVIPTDEGRVAAQEALALL
ncbi:MAG: acetate/propionate family kinase [Sulfuritalea sp.]|nr:acetate/propionate family kinase [Polynucleobacter sp.]MCF8187616.1 acetate/propionate family kinase [Sulfuritalea sp.]